MERMERIQFKKESADAKRRMSFAMTIEQASNRTKTVTRRKGWDTLRPGDIIQQVEKGQGLKKGEKQVKIHLIKIISNIPEKLVYLLLMPAYGKAECIKEGFPDKSIKWFVDMYCKHNGRRIDGFKISFALHVFGWRLRPLLAWNFGDPVFIWLCFTIRGCWEYEL